MYSKNRKIAGFSLVELSIVIIIIGLLFVGITGGSKLIEQAKLKTVINDLNKIDRIFRVFYTAYNELPGDFEGASNLWSCSNCNGNGDGVIGFTGVFPYTNSEHVKIWKHLEYAELLDQSVTGVMNSSGAYFSNQNAYQFKYNSNAIAVVQDATDAWTKGWMNNYDYRGKNVIHITPVDFGYIGASTALFTPKDLYSIDSKIDDGKPRKGKIYGFNPVRDNNADWDGVNGSSGPFCSLISTKTNVTAAQMDSDEYSLSSDQKLCVITVDLRF